MVLRGEIAAGGGCSDEGSCRRSTLAHNIQARIVAGREPGTESGENLRDAEKAEITEIPKSLNYEILKWLGRQGKELKS
jgi:hypothetical protein